MNPLYFNLILVILFCLFVFWTIRIFKSILSLTELAVSLRIPDLQKINVSQYQNLSGILDENTSMKDLVDGIINGTMETPSISISKIISPFCIKRGSFKVFLSQNDTRKLVKKDKIGESVTEHQEISPQVINETSAANDKKNNGYQSSSNVPVKKERTSIVATDDRQRVTVQFSFTSAVALSVSVFWGIGDIIETVMKQESAINNIKSNSLSTGITENLNSESNEKIIDMTKIELATKTEDSSIQERTVGDGETPILTKSDIPSSPIVLCSNSPKKFNAGEDLFYSCDNDLSISKEKRLLVQLKVEDLDPNNNNHKDTSLIGNRVSKNDYNGRSDITTRVLSYYLMTTIVEDPTSNSHEQMNFLSISPSTIYLEIENVNDGRRNLFQIQELYGADCKLKATEDECVVCLTEPKAITLLPCRHFCLCHGCFLHIEKCPICRMLIRAFIIMTPASISQQNIN